MRQSVDLAVPRCPVKLSVEPVFFASTIASLPTCQARWLCGDFDVPLVATKWTISGHEIGRYGWNKWDILWTK